MNERKLKQNNMPSTCVICKRTSRRFKDISFIPFPKNVNLKEKWLKSLNLDEESVKKSTRVCSMHFMNGQRDKQSVPSLSVGKNWGSKSLRKKPKNRKVTESTKRVNSNVTVNKSVTSSLSPSSDSTSNNNSMGPSGDSSNSSKFKLVSVEHYNILQQKINELEAAKSRLVKENTYLSSKSFSVHNFINNDDAIQYYTGFPDSKTFISVFELIGKPTQYFGYLKKCTDRCLGRQRNLDPLNEFFMYWVKMRQNIPDRTLGFMFGVSSGTVNTVLTTWCLLINSVFKQLPFYPSSAEFAAICPSKLKNMFPRCIAIYDCTELYTEMPSKLDIQRVFWSEYYHHHTAKALIGITLWGSVSFVSKLYPGSITDAEIFNSSGAADLVKPGDQIMVDKGFLIDDQVVAKGGTVVRPPFKNPKNKQFNPQQVENSRQIASVRIYVEQAIKRIKAYRYLDQLSISQLQLSSYHFQNISFATNFQSSFVSATNPLKNENKLQTLYEKFCKAADAFERNIDETNDDSVAESYPPFPTENFMTPANIDTLEASEINDENNDDVDLHVVLGLFHLLESGNSDGGNESIIEIEPTIQID